MQQFTGCHIPNLKQHSQKRKTAEGWAALVVVVVGQVCMGSAEASHMTQKKGVRIENGENRVLQSVFLKREE